MRPYPHHPVPDPSGSLAPPRTPPPAAVGLIEAEPPEPGPVRGEGRLGGGLLGLLRRLEIAVFGARRTVGPRPGPTPTF